MNRPLTKQQQFVYNFIREKIISRGYGPTVREIGEHMNIKSPNGVMCHLRALERKEMITRTANKSRAIELTEPISRLVGASLQVRGAVAAGACLLEQDTTRDFDLAQFCKDEKYTLQVKDDTLIDAHILSGDFVVIQARRLAQNGQLAIVRTGDSETCLRYWISDGARIHLQPANRSLPPKIVDHAEVLGVVVGVIRDLRPLMTL